MAGGMEEWKTEQRRQSKFFMDPIYIGLRLENCYLFQMKKREARDVQTTFLLNKLQYTVDLLIQENNGHITNARPIDTMIPI
jgi:hypothetical protein